MCVSEIAILPAINNNSNNIIIPQFHQHGPLIHAFICVNVSAHKG